MSLLNKIGTIYEYYRIEKNNQELESSLKYNKILKGDEILYFFLRSTVVLNPYRCQTLLAEDYHYANIKDVPTLNTIERWINSLCGRQILLLDHIRIQKSSSKNSQKGSKKTHYYKITDYGLYYIMKKYLHRENEDVLLSHKSSFIIKTFLLPCLEASSIEKIKDRLIIKELFLYLQNCCVTINRLLQELDDVEEKNSYVKVVNSHDSIVSYEKHMKNIPLIDSIKLVGPYKSINPDILDTLEKLSLEEINSSERTNTPEINYVLEHLKEILRDNTNWFSFELEKHKSLLCNRIIEYTCSGNTLHKKDKGTKEISVKHLREDEKFRNLVRSTRTRSDSFFNNFMSN